MFTSHDKLAKRRDRIDPVPTTNRCGSPSMIAFGGTPLNHAIKLGGWQPHDKSGTQHMAGAVTAILRGKLTVQRFDDLPAY
jgi:hypothetical protein